MVNPLLMNYSTFTESWLYSKKFDLLTKAQIRLNPAVLIAIKPNKKQNQNALISSKNTCHLFI